MTIFCNPLSSKQYLCGHTWHEVFASLCSLFFISSTLHSFLFPCSGYPGRQPTFALTVKTSCISLRAFGIHRKAFFSLPACLLLSGPPFWGASPRQESSLYPPVLPVKFKFGFMLRLKPSVCTLKPCTTQRRTDFCILYCSRF